MNQLLDRIERELMTSVRRSVARRRARRRTLLVAAMTAGVLLLASAASAVSGIGPAAGLFDAKEAIPPSREPEPGGRLALIHAGDEGAGGWDLLVYRSEPPRFGAPVRPYCVALARSDSKSAPRSGIDGPQSPADVYGGSVGCEHPLTFAARIVRQPFHLEGYRGGAYLAGPQRPGAAPFYGLAPAETERITLTQEGDEPVEAELSAPFRVKVPPLTPRLIRDLNPRQRRLTKGLPRVVEVRSFLGVLEAPVVPAGQPIPVVTVRAQTSTGKSLTRTTGGQVVEPPSPVQPNLTEPRPGEPMVGLSASGSDGKRWRAVGYRTRDGAICAGIARLPTTRQWDKLSCGGGLGVVEPLVRGGLRQGASTDRLGLPRLRSTYSLFGLTRADTSSLTFVGRNGVRVRATLSPAWTTAEWNRSELRSYVDKKAKRRAAQLPRRIGVRLYLAVVPPGARSMEPRVTLQDGRILNGRWAMR